MYSGFENLYFRVEMNFGLISTKNYLTSDTAVERSDFLYFVNFSMSFVQQSIFLSCLHESIKAAAASSDGLNLIKVISKSETSRIY